MLALIGNLDLMEVLVIVLAAIMIFGKDLPEVAVKAAAQVVRLRRAVTKMWREAGIEDEIRRVQRDIEQAKPRIPPFDPLMNDADRRRAERQRELRELTPRPDLEHAAQDGNPDQEHADTGGDAWVRGEGDVDDAFQPGPDATLADPFAGRREPEGEVGGGDEPDVPAEGEAGVHEAAADEVAARDEGESEPDSKESA